MRDLLSKDHKCRLKLRERPDTGVYVEVDKKYENTLLLASPRVVCTF